MLVDLWRHLAKAAVQPGLFPKKVPDKNGRYVTRYFRADEGGGAPTPPRAPAEPPPAAPRPARAKVSQGELFASRPEMPGRPKGAPLFAGPLFSQESAASGAPRAPERARPLSEMRLGELPRAEDDAVPEYPVGGHSRPHHTEPLPEGSWRLEGGRGAHGHRVEQLRYLDPATLKVRRRTRGGVGELADVARYARWLREGKQPPPARAFELEDGSVAVIDGYRRLAAAKQVGVKLPVWVSPLVETGETRADGSKVKVPLTYELAVKRAGAPVAKGSSLTELARHLVKGVSQGTLFDDLLHPIRDNPDLEKKVIVDPLGRKKTKYVRKKPQQAAGKQAITDPLGRKKTKYVRKKPQQTLGKRFWIELEEHGYKKGESEGL